MSDDEQNEKPNPDPWAGLDDGGDAEGGEGLSFSFDGLDDAAAAPADPALPSGVSDVPDADDQAIIHIDSVPNLPFQTDETPFGTFSFSDPGPSPDAAEPEAAGQESIPGVFGAEGFDDATADAALVDEWLSAAEASDPEHGDAAQTVDDAAVDQPPLAVFPPADAAVVPFTGFVADGSETSEER